jgi:hypothetical protein
MSKNSTQIKSQQDLSIDNVLKLRYNQLLKDEKNKRPSWEEQSFSQKMDARFSGLSSTFLSVMPVFLALNFPAMLLIPITYAASAKEARIYDEKVNPEKYYEIKALERLAIESGKLNPPGGKHRVFGGNILGGGIGDYGTNLNEAIKDLAKIVGAPENIKYNSPRESLNDLNIVTRSINKAVTSVESYAKDFGKDSKKSVGKIFNLFFSQPPAQEGNAESENTNYKKILNFFKELFGLSKNSSHSKYVYDSKQVTTVSAVAEKSSEFDNETLAEPEKNNSQSKPELKIKNSNSLPNNSIVPTDCTKLYKKNQEIRAGAAAL